ncbi:hypothetical protein Q0601_22400 [Paracoccus onubensis]|uniref:hypothetical protein n=1 Tax=Paracoccus onubensis TaxID=1675788 RepID=UPI00273079E8|nr:hypothetical protein [Paracoccus onubensis]MDP0929941.1 hypothetical protein [Paracoccus onubensis]
MWENALKGGSQDFLRLPPIEQDNFLDRIGLSSDGMALIVCARQLHIIPVERIAALKLQKIRPAKGGSGAALSLAYHHPWPSPDTEREIGLSGSFGQMDALDDLASHLNNALNCLLRIPEPQYDC